MQLFRKLKTQFNDANSGTRREIVIALILFLIAIIVNIPSLIENLRNYYAPK